MKYQPEEAGEPRPRRRMTALDMEREKCLQDMTAHMNELLYDAQHGLIDYDEDCRYRFNVSAEAHQPLIVPVSVTGDGAGSRMSRMEESIKKLQDAVDGIQQPDRKDLFRAIRKNASDLLSLQVEILNDRRSVAWAANDWSCLSSLFFRSLAVDIGHGGLFCAAYLLRCRATKIAYALGSTSLRYVAI